jgi:branched-chain amino acid transport system ATP-binding protein
MELVDTLHDVQREHSTAILLVEHDVEMVQRFATRLYVLDFGTLIASGKTEDVMNDASVRRAYLGDLV